MKHIHLIIYMALAMLTLTACGDDDSGKGQPGGQTATAVTSGTLEMPAPKGGKSIIVTHTATLNELSGATGTNYTIEWDTELHSQRWSCYKMYNGNYGAGKGKDGATIQRYSATNDGSLSTTCQYPNDQDLPVHYRLTIDPYKYSGYDHGHICPSEDRRRAREANYQTFYITNMQPQGNDFNGGIWSDMEKQVRIWANDFDTLYVCKGGTIDKASDIVEYVCQSSHQKSRVNSNHIPVPRYFFMAVLGRQGSTFHATAFWIDQTSYRNTSLRGYVKTVGELQELTGIDFFHTLPDSIEDEVENPGHPKMQQEWTWYK